jgi:hypothetical protein
MILKRPSLGEIFMNLWDALLEAIGVEVEVDVELAIGDRQIIGEGAQAGGTEEKEEE